MKISHLNNYTSQTYHVDDGPIEETAPGYLSQGKFKVDYLSVTYMNGELQKVYIKGPHLKADGNLGKSTRARTYFRDVPQWVLDFLNKEES